MVSRAPKKKPSIGYYERHRIVPGCMGGKYVESNIAWLTPEEHYVAHQLLVKIYPSVSGLVKAAHAMALTRKGNKSYGWLKRKKAEVERLRFLQNNPMLNFEFVEKQKVCLMGNDFVKGRIWINDGITSKRWANTSPIPEGFQVGRLPTKSTTMKGYKWINNGVVNMTIKSEDGLPEGYKYGMLPKPNRWDK